jgi:hypothetical protein
VRPAVTAAPAVWQLWCRPNMCALGQSLVFASAVRPASLQTLVSEDGGVAEAPLLHPIEEEALEENEIREGAPIERTERVPCTIALAKVPT